MLESCLRAIIAPLMPGLLNHLWQSTVCLVIAGLLTLILRKNHARARYGLWLAASIKFLIPFALLITLGMHLARPTAELGPAPDAPLFFAVEEVGQPFTKGPHAQERRLPRELAADWRYRFIPAIPPIGAAVWLGGFLLVLAGWWRRWRQVANSLQAAVPLYDGREVAALRRVEQRAGMKRPLEVWLSPTSLEPGIFGIVRPVLVWPAGISEHLQDAHLEAILGHEVWHVRRRDNLAGAIHMVVEALFWFHPLVWWLGTRLVEERERACDEEVLQLGGEPHVYAESILKTCQFCLESPLACVSGITGAELKARIVRIMTQRAADKLSFGRKLLLTAIGISVIAGPVVFGLMNAPQIRAQSSATASVAKSSTGSEAENAGAKTPAYDVISIKPYKGDNSGGMAGGRHGNLSMVNTQVMWLIETAYGMSDYRISGEPRWVGSDRFDVEAKMDEEAAAAFEKLPKEQQAKQRQWMIQSLLADRCKLKVHHETKILPTYALVIAKGGFKLKEADPNNTYANGIRLPAGFSGAVSLGPGNKITAQATPMSRLVGPLSVVVHGPVVDNTGITGKYNITLQWAPDQGAAPPDENGPLPQADSGPSIFTALQEQLGLKLVPTKGPVDTIVIDHIERPSVN